MEYSMFIYPIKLWISMYNYAVHNYVHVHNYYVYIFIYFIFLLLGAQTSSQVQYSQGS